MLPDPQDNMTQKAREAVEKLRQFIQEEVLSEEEGLLTGFVLVVETMDLNERVSLGFYTPEGQPSWRGEGYLHKALEYGLEPENDDWEPGS